MDLQLNPGWLGINPKDFFHHPNDLTQAGIETRTYFDPPVHLQKAYAPYRAATGTLPVTEQIATEVLNVPLFVGLRAADVERVARIITAGVRRAVTV